MSIARASLKRRLVILFLCAIVAVAGVAAYFSIGKLEDPEFTIKTALVTVIYPGASTYEVEREATSRVEDAVQAMGEVKRIRSLSTPGMAIIYVDIKDKFMARDLPQIWDVLRQKLYDVQVKMPKGSTILIDNDFGDVYGQYYALVGDGYNMRELWDYADFLKKQLVLVPEVARVKILGEQQEAIYVELSTSRLTSLGISPAMIISVLNQQNNISAVGNTMLGDRYIRISPSSAIMSVEDIGDLVIGGVGGRLIRLKEVAEVRRAERNPQRFMMNFNGRPALGIGIATVKGGNVVSMGERVTARLKQLEGHRPVGMELNEIYMQSQQVTKSINDFIVNLLESLTIVVGVLLVFMGLRTGLLIGIVLLLTVAGTFAIMNAAGIFLQIVSLASLIIALGSLVDNAIVVSEGMLVGVERHIPVDDAADQAVESSKWAMLGGTVIAVMAFCPIGLSRDSTGEYCRSLLQVVGISMFLSWIAALTVTPVFGSLMLKPGKQNTDPYDRTLFRMYRSFLERCLRHKITTLALTAAMFAFAVYGCMNLDKTFFPDANTAYFTVDLWQDEGTNLKANRETTLELEKYLREQPETKNVTSFIGGGSLRFMLTYSPLQPNSAYSMLLVETKNAEETQPLLLKTQNRIDNDMAGTSGVCKRFSKGSGMAPKIEVRFYGENPAVLRELASQARKIVEGDPDHNFVRIDWREPVEVFKPQVLKDQMQNLGLSRPLINGAILSATGGLPVGVFRDGDKSLPIMIAMLPEQRDRIDRLKSFPVWAPTANSMVPLGTVLSSLDVDFEDHIIWRRNRSRVITVASEIKPGANADQMRARIHDAIENIKLPMGYTLEWGGEKELSDDAINGMKVTFFPALLAMFTIMVFLFNSFRPPLIIFAALPLIIIGVVPGLWVARMPMSFLAIVGMLSLVGMLAKNSIVLLDQVSEDFAAGKNPYLSIVNDAVGRLRPVAMSALTTVLGMIPLIKDLMFGPMAVTIMAGLTVSTVLTLIIIPVMTAIVYKVPCPEKNG